MHTGIYALSQEFRRQNPRTHGRVHRCTIYIHIHTVKQVDFHLADDVIVTDRIIKKEYSLMANGWGCGWWCSLISVNLTFKSAIIGDLIVRISFVEIYIMFVVVVAIHSQILPIAVKMYIRNCSSLHTTVDIAFVRCIINTIIIRPASPPAHSAI